MSANETDALVARVERIIAIAERQVGCIPEMFHLADADDGRLLQECSAEYPHQCFDEPGHHALTLADLRALLAQLEAAKRDSARIERFIVEALDNEACADLLRSLVNAGRNNVMLATALAYWPPFERLSIDAASTPAGAPENG